MAFVVKDRVKQSTTTTGTGSIVLNGTVSGFQTFANALSDGDTTYYSLFEVSTNNWEVGVGTWTESTTTLARTTILASSNSGSAVNLTAQAEVFIAQPAGKAAFFDPSGDLTLVQDPTSNLQAATKQYVDTIAAAGLHYHDPVRVEQEGNLSATYSNGTAGVGATLTNNSTQAALTIDGVALSLNDRVLIYEQTNGYENGIYTVTNVGSASTNWVLTRATDADSYAPSDPDSLGQGDAFFVLEGAAGAGELYVMNTSGTITFGTTNITFTQVAATAVYSAGTGLTLTGTQFSADGANITNVDAVTLDGIDSSQFLRSDVVDTKTAGNLNFSDNVKAIFGAGSDLQIYHDGTNSIIGITDTHTGKISNITGGEDFITFTPNNAVNLYYDNALKLATTSTGVDITGTLTSDGLTVEGSDFILGTFERTSPTGGVGIELKNGDNNSWQVTNGGDEVYTLRYVPSGGSAVKYFTASSGGDISFYEDTGTTAKFFWDASAEAVGIGTASPTHTISLESAYPYISFNETDQSQKWVIGGASGNFVIYDDTDAATRLAVDGSGNVGIGTTSPSDYDANGDNLVIGTTSGNNGISIASGTTGLGSIFFADATSGVGLYTGLIQYNHSSDYMRFFTASSERMRIDTSGNVGIGTTSPTNKLTAMAGASNTAVATFGGVNTGRGLVISTNTGGGLNEAGVDFNAQTATYGQLRFSIAGSEAARIDSSGNLLVGTTDGTLYDNTTGSGFAVTSAGRIYNAVTSNSAQILNRMSTDGDIVQFRKDGTTVGSIQADAGALTIGTGTTNINLRTDSGKPRVIPRAGANTASNGLIDLGDTGSRFKDLYLSGSLSDGTTSRTVADIVGLTSSQFLRSDQADTINGNLTIGGTSHIVMQEGHYVNRRFEVDSADGSSTIYILLCLNAANNDVNGTITMDRTSGLRFACSWDIIVSTGSATGPLGSLVGHSLAGAGQPSARLVTLTYSSASYVALELTNPDQYYENTGAYFNGRIVNSGSNTFTCLQPASVSAVSSLYISTSRTIMSNNLEVGNVIYVPNQIIHDGDDDTNITFGTDTITLNAGGSAEVTIDTTGVRLGDTGNGYFRPVTGGYGSIEISGGAHNGYEGYNIGGRVVFMHNNSATSYIYDDVNTKAFIKMTNLGAVELYYNGTSKLQTSNTGANINGDLNAVDNIYVADNIYHEGDTDTYVNFGTDYIRIYTGGSYTQFTASGPFINDGSLAEDYDALSGTTPTCNVDNGGAFSLTMTGNTTFTFSGAASGYSQGFILQLTGDATTAYTVTWPTSVDWAGGTAPDAPAVGETDIYVFWTRDGGTTWYGVQSIDAAA